MKSVSKKICSIALSATMIMAMATPAIAQSDCNKEEVIYINLNYDGSVSDIFVVNSYDLSAEAKIIDYGEYTSVRNLTTTEKIKFENGEASFTAPKGKFYYQGNLPVREIPWNVDISYTLDGKKISGDELAGKSGHLEIVMSITLNDNVNPVYRENFAIQATASFDSDKCKNIEAPNATIASVGNKKQLSYIVLPDKEKEFKISTDITDFEMDGITINGIPLTLDIDDPDTTDLMSDVYDLQDGAIELDDGANKLDEGVTTLNEGVEELKDGSEDLKEGTEDLRDATKKLKEGSDALEDGFSKLGSNASALKGGIKKTQTQISENTNILVAKVNEGIGTSIADVRISTGSSTAELIANGKAIEAKLREIASVLGIDLPKGTSVLSAAVIEGEPVKAESEAKADEAAAEAPKAEALPEKTELPEEKPEEAPKEEVIEEKVVSEDKALLKAEKLSALPTEDNLKKLVYELYSMHQLSFGMVQYIAGVEQLSSGYNDMYEGIGKIDKGAKKLDDAVDELEDGVDKLFDGVLALKEGTIELTDGTFELRDETADMDTTVDDKIDEMLDEYRNNDFDPVSFVSEKNTNINKVQFAMKTKEIKMEDEKDAPIEQEEEIGFFQRLLNLFKYKKEN